MRSSGASRTPPPQAAPPESSARAALSADPGPRPVRRAGDLLGRRKLSVVRVTLGCMEVTENDVARIPAGNLRVSRDEFAMVWAAAEQRSAAEAARGVTDWYAAGVNVTCRWLAGAVTTSSDGRRRLPMSPVTERTATAYEELIEAEYLAAELLDVHRPRLLVSRPGWCEAIRATLRWSWRRNGPPPITLPVHAAG